MKEGKFYTPSLIALVLFLGYFTFQIFRPFLAPIGWAIVFAIVLYPVHALIFRRVRSGSLSAIAMLILILAATLGPLSYISYQLAHEVRTISFDQTAGEITRVFSHPYVRPLVDWILSAFNITEEQFQASVIANLTKLGKYLLSHVGGGIGDVVNGAFNFLLMAFTLFFLLKDGPEFLVKMRDYLPFPENERRKLAKQVKDIVVSTIYGGVAVAFVQALIGMIGFAAVGIHAPVLWGLVMAIASFIPVVGCAIVWVPATLYLLFKGAIVNGIALAAIGIFGISLVDNFLRPIIIKGRVRMPLLLIFFSVFGGIQFFGIIGIVLGPLVVAVFVSALGVLKASYSVSS
jgi:predicted PurR-regulated permease PerM